MSGRKKEEKKEKTIPNNLLDTNTYLGVLVYQHSYSSEDELSSYNIT